MWLKGLAGITIFCVWDPSVCFNNLHKWSFSITGGDKHLVHHLLTPPHTSLPQLIKNRDSSTTKYHDSLKSSHDTWTFAYSTKLVFVTAALYASRLIANSQFENLIVLMAIAQYHDRTFPPVTCYADSTREWKRPKLTGGREKRTGRPMNGCTGPSTHVHWQCAHQSAWLSADLCCVFCCGLACGYWIM